VSTQLADCEARFAHFTGSVKTTHPTTPRRSLPQEERSE
jgi:hypothetical protein